MAAESLQRTCGFGRHCCTQYHYTCGGSQAYRHLKTSTQVMYPPLCVNQLLVSHALSRRNLSTAVRNQSPVANRVPSLFHSSVVTSLFLSPTSFECLSTIDVREASSATFEPLQNRTGNNQTSRAQHRANSNTMSTRLLRYPVPDSTNRIHSTPTTTNIIIQGTRHKKKGLPCKTRSPLNRQNFGLP